MSDFPYDKDGERIAELESAVSNLLSGMEYYQPSLGQKWLVDDEDIAALAALIKEGEDDE